MYDDHQRLCKTIDPEAGATVIDYDAAGNIAWVATGTSLTALVCDRASVSSGKSTRAYDPRNRLTQVLTPGGAADVTTTYTADGRVASLVAANGPLGANPVTTTYSYNRRRLLTAEASARSGYLYELALTPTTRTRTWRADLPGRPDRQLRPGCVGPRHRRSRPARRPMPAASATPERRDQRLQLCNGVVHSLTRAPASRCRCAAATSRRHGRAR
jgi:YD repeat-containing protein